MANHGELASKYDEATDIREETSGVAFQSKAQFDNCYHRLDKTKICFTYYMTITELETNKIKNIFKLLLPINKLRLSEANNGKLRIFEPTGMLLF